MLAIRATSSSLRSRAVAAVVGSTVRACAVSVAPSVFPNRSLSTTASASAAYGAVAARQSAPGGVRQLQQQRSAPFSTAASTPSHIPVVDFGRFTAPGATEAQRAAVAAELVSAFTTTGFVYLANHTVPADLLAAVFAQSRGFFERPIDEKMRIAWETPESNRGYVAPGREKVTRLLEKADVEKLKAAAPDMKESLEIGKEPSTTFQNRWPTHDPAFRPTMERFFGEAHALHLRLLSALAIGLGLEESFFNRFCDARDHNLRLLHYPTVDADRLAAEGQVRAGAHTDYGTVTLLFQDQRGGLEVKTPSGEWAEATPIPGTVVINAGDLLARWSNDVIRSTEHRVVSPRVAPTEAGGSQHGARYSVAFFCNPNQDAVVEGLPGVGGGPKYPPVRTSDYLVMRLAATY